MSHPAVDRQCLTSAQAHDRSNGCTSIGAKMDGAPRQREKLCRLSAAGNDTSWTAARCLFTAVEEPGLTTAAATR
jgi:hypothetical protein